MDRSPAIPLSARLKQGFEILFPWLILGVLILYTYAYFVKVPYTGFIFSEGVVLDVDPSPLSEVLQVGDRLLEVDGVDMAAFSSSLTLPLLADARPGSTIPILLERGGEIQLVAWTFPGPTLAAVLERLLGTWWLAYVFWFAGTATLLLIRPRDTRWKLLVTFHYFNALWLTTGSGPSHWRIWYSTILVGSFVWLSVPVCIHLHWVFPRQIRKIPFALLVPLYGSGLVLAVAEWFEVLPIRAFYYGFALAILVSAISLLLRWFRQKEDRQDISILALAVVLIMLPILAATLPILLGYNPPSFISGGAIMALPALPGAYFLVAYRRQFHLMERRIRWLSRQYLGIVILGSALVILVSAAAYGGDMRISSLPGSISLTLISLMSAVLGFSPFIALPAVTGEAFILGQSPGYLQIRANHLLGAFLFLLAGGGSLLLAILLASFWLEIPAEGTLIAIAAALVAGAAVAAGVRPFQALVNRVLWKMEQDPDEVLADFLDRISTSLEPKSVAALLRDELLPGLMVRQSALVQVSGGSVKPFFTLGLKPEQIPMPEQLADLAAQAGNPLVTGSTNADLAGWVRLVIPLKLQQAVTGFWLFGQRDPEDFYSPADTRLFEQLASQVAFALAHIEQAALLRTLYSTNLDRYEEERQDLARLLHDHVLSQLVALTLNETSTDSPQFLARYAGITNSIRGLVTTLRPSMLNYGLWRALDELVDDLSERLVVGCLLRLEIPRSEVRYDPKVEEHLFRIVQQACENALQHAQAATVRVCGELLPDRATLVVEDDGVGLPFTRHDLSNLLANRHFGLAGIHERAHLIGANLTLESSPGRGTRLHLSYTPNLIHGSRP